MRTCSAVLLVAATVGAAHQTAPSPRLIRSIELPDVQGRIDHLALDAASQTLYVAALGNNSVEVVDVRNGTRTATIQGLKEPQGVAVVAALHAIVVANGEGDGIQILDAKDHHVIRSVRLGDDSDNVRYDPGANRVYVGYGGGAIAAIEPGTGNVIGRAALPGHPESFQLDGAGSRIYVNVPSAGEIAVLDRAAMKVTATWPVTAARSNYPMALDDAGHRLFVGCRRPARVLVFDTQTGRLEGFADIVGDTDDLFYDSKRARLYVSGGGGFLDVLDVKDSAHITRIVQVPTAPGARTSLFAPDTGSLFVAVPHRAGQRAEIRVYAMRD